jgi:hypothetical protein
MKHASATCETCVWNVLETSAHLLETYATYHGYLCFNVCMLDAHAW